MSRTIPSSPTLLSAHAHLHRHLPRLFSIRDHIACSRHRRGQPQPRSHPRLQERYTNNLHTLVQTKPFCPPRGPKPRFFTAAKTGAGMSEVFEYVARRMAMRWEWEEEEIHVDVPDFVGNYSTVHISDAMTGTKWSFWHACCSL
jgi:hypothetical protein